LCEPRQHFLPGLIRHEQVRKWLVRQHDVGHNVIVMEPETDDPANERERRVLFEAARSHDVRFDGRIYIGVTSTGIYCRPVCTVKMPKFANCTFFRHAAAAEKSGFRPCLVCRPEIAPGDAKVDAVSKLARLALRRIEDGALNASTIDELGAEFDVSARHLRRALVAEFGVTPIELAQTQRLLQAKQLLSETDLSVTDVAFAAGFDSLRRFNALFKSRYRLAPTAVRRQSTCAAVKRGGNADRDALDFRIDYRPPLNWNALLEFLAARAIPGVEGSEHNAYCRTVRIGEHRGWVSVTPLRTRKRVKPVHALTVSMSPALSPVCAQVLQKVKTVFDTRANAADIDGQLARDPLLGEAIARHGGMRLPGAFDGFELLLRAILGQQVSVKGATTLAGRAAAAFGEPLATPLSMLTHATPEPERIADASIDQIAKLGMPGKRAQTIKTVARAFADGELGLEPGSDPDVVRDRLIAVSGIGEWTASYVAMRALAWPDALPLGDLGIKKALGMTRAADILERTEAWRPWRAYGAIYLWMSLSGG